MAARRNLVDELYRSLDKVAPHEMMPVIEVALGDTIGATDVSLLLADYAEMTLERFDLARAAEHLENRSVSIEATVPGSCYRRQEIVTDPAGQEATRWTVCAPVSVRSERFGVLEIGLASPPSSDAEEVAAQVASALAYVIASARRYTDVFERVRRRRSLALAAEIQWELLPVLGYDAEEFRLAGSLEPAYEIGGDNFDYAIDGDLLTLSISDAMGHGVRAALCATLAVTAMRNSRRAGHGVVEQAGLANHALYEQFGGDMFVTTLAMEIDVPSGRGTAVNAGHPAAWRHGRSSVGPLELDPDRPLGMFADSTYRPQPVQLSPGDRLVLLTDGLFEVGRNREGDVGLDRFTALVAEHREATPREFVRHATQAVLGEGAEKLRDDATLLCLDWIGTAP